MKQSSISFYSLHLDEISFAVFFHINTTNLILQVEIDRKQIFIGSLEKRTHARLQQKVLKFKAWLSSDLFQKHFPLHYNEISSALPLPEYVDPVSGLLNVSVKLPKDLSKTDLGPCIYFSYGGPEELMQADYLSKLCYESHDTVGIDQIYIEYPYLALLYTNALCNPFVCWSVYLRSTAHANS